MKRSSNSCIARQQKICFTLLLILCCIVGNEAKLDQGQCTHYMPPFLKVPSLSSSSNKKSSNGNNYQRRIAEEEKACDICGGLRGTGILPDAPIPSLANAHLPRDAPFATTPNEGTCNDWSNLLAQNATAGSYECIYYTYFLSQQCCDMTNATASYECEANLKEKLLGDESRYETTAVPVPAGEHRLNITVSLTFYHISSLDTVEGTTEIFFGIDLYWIDERLKWDPAEYGGCTDLALRASLNPETTEIYVPDFDLLNRATGVQNLPEEMALVAPDGTVRWRRNGGLKGICAFTGLESIPFDTLGCYYTFGSNTDHKVNYIFGKGDPKTPGLFFSYFPAKYQEFSLKHEDSETFYHTGLDLVRQLRYQFYFDRANRYYIMKIIVPTILFTYLSFGTFMLDQRVGERLGYGVSLLLVIVAQSIVTSDMLPISNERLWIDTFALASYYWVILAVLESVLVAYLYYLDSEEEKEEERLQSERRAEEEELRKETSQHTAHDIFIQNDNDANIHTDTPTYVEVSVNDSENGGGEHSTTKPGSASGKKASFSDEDIDNKNQSAAAPTSRKPRLQRGHGHGVSLAGVLVGKQKTTERKKLQIIRNLDRFCLIFLPITYTIFIIVMFATNSIWGS